MSFKENSGVSEREVKQSLMQGSSLGSGRKQFHSFRKSLKWTRFTRLLPPEANIRYKNCRETLSDQLNFPEEAQSH